MSSSFKQRVLGAISKTSGQVPTGLVNGSNVIFQTGSSYIAGSLEVYKNGIRLKAGVGNDYIETSASTFTMATAPITGTQIIVDYLTAASTSGNADTLDGNEAEDLMPIGSVIDYASDTMPSSKWLLCYGQAISRTTYATLFGRLGTTYGSGDGSTTFNLPDLRGRVVAGQDDMGGTSADRLTGLSGGVDGDVLGGSGGAQSHTLSVAEMPSHWHQVTSRINNTTGANNGSAFSLNNGAAGGSAYYNITGTVTTNDNIVGNNVAVGALPTGGGSAHNNVQPTAILNKIIKVL